ncbi:MAG: response regulator [Bacteroidota bacterium]
MNKRRLLLAEDDEDDRMLFSDFLEERNDFELVHSCENGMEVIEYLDAIINVDELPNLVVLDQNMPKMTGSQTLQSLKSTPRYAQIPVAVYTTYMDRRLIDECYKSGAITVVAKPISPSGYHQMMDELIDLIPN